MAFVPALDCAETVLRFTLPNLNEAVNVLNFRFLGGLPDDTDLNVLWDLMKTWHAAFYDTCQSNGVSLSSIYVRGLTTAFEPVIDAAVAPAQVGAVTTPPLPANVTLAISHRTGLAGRSRRGRSYVVGLAEGDVVGDFVTAARVTTINTAFNALRAAGTFVAAGWQFVVLSRFSEGELLDDAVVTPITTSFCVDGRVDTQRRRLIGEGT